MNRERSKHRLRVSEAPFSASCNNIGLTVGKDILLEIITKHVVTKRLVNRGTAYKPIWEREYCAFEPSEREIRTLLIAKTLEEGGLAQRLPKFSSEPLRLKEQQERDARARLNIGEPQEKLAREYSIDVDTIRRLAR